jgi:hypothetical protein
MDTKKTGTSRKTKGSGLSFHLYSSRKNYIHTSKKLVFLLVHGIYQNMWIEIPTYNAVRPFAMPLRNLESIIYGCTA